jgi:DNA-binding NarL/FixJ family response regulator
VLIADDHAVVRDGLKALLSAQAGLSIVGEAGSGREACRLAAALKPDVILLDLSMPDGGIEAAERLAEEVPSVRVLVLTMHEERGYLSRLLRAGVAGYAVKRSAAAEVVRAIRAVHAGERYVDPSLAGALLGDQAERSGARSSKRDTALSDLTPREEQVLRLLALGHSNKEIANLLAISVKTVETHRSSGMIRLGIANRAALVRFALQEGWLRE